jgi:hypothetical protein
MTASTAYGLAAATFNATTRHQPHARRWLGKGHGYAGTATRPPELDCAFEAICEKHKGVAPSRDGC